MSDKQTEKANVQQRANFKAYDYLYFIIPSVIGILLFMFPITTAEDGITIPVAFLAEQLGELLEGILPSLLTIMLLFVAIMTVWSSMSKPSFVQQRPVLKELFDVHPVWVMIRVLGLILAVLTLYELGPEWIWSAATGGLLLFDLAPLLFTIFLFAGLLLPLLLNFGLLELCGELLNRVMRPIFTLPGRSSIDCLTSWMGDGTIGVLLTNKQYEQGFYTQREAAVIGTTFSVVSITFSIVVLSYLEIEHLFMPYYLTLVVAGLIAAVIIPRIPPLSRKPDTYIEEQQQEEDHKTDGLSPLKRGLYKAVARAKENSNPVQTLSGGVKNVLDMWFAVIPVVIAIGTVAVIIAEHTPLFAYLGAPFVPLLQLLQVPEAAQAAETMVIGFADMLLPAIIGSGIESEFTRFVIACLSVTQLIYMSEVGGLLLASKLPVKFTDLMIIFIERTLITLPVIVLMAHIIL
ncbi:YjiH family protein [Caldalkalibacillus salinus]|uniref:YjiH family protein n=1 Tax=Caldalkalibacillus salinus TaxID=2803787 RepID=UPI0019230EB2|nr:YjiH family protein [Caldalkalibacillus salinus]